MTAADRRIGVRYPRDDRRDRPFIGTARLVDPEPLRERFDWPHANTRRLDWVEEAVMAAAIWEAWRDPERWISYSRSHQWWSSGGHRYLDRRFGVRTVTAAVDRLEWVGLLQHHRKHPSANNHGYQSRFRGNLEIRVAADWEPPPPLFHVRMRDAILLRDENKVSIGFAENRFTQKQRRIIAQLQEALDGIAVDLDAAAPCLSRRSDFVRLRDKNGDAYGVHLKDRPYFTVFSQRSWKKGGRKYGPWAQNVPKDIRAHITIDGAPTAELDYGQTHARILCAWANLEIDIFDIFDIAGFDRKLVKVAFYVLVNAATETQAISAIAHKLKRKGGRAEAVAITAAIKGKFPALVPYLHTGIGLALQRVDAEIAETVLLDLLRKAIFALPIHDSFIVRANDAGPLEEAMDTAWTRHVGSRSVLACK
jgi:hypothetical protein